MDKIHRATPLASSLLVLVLLGFMSPVRAQQKARIAVLEVENQTSWWGDQLGRSAADLLTTRLVNSGRFIVIERAQISRVIDEQELEWTGAVRTDQVVELGQLLGVQYMLVGSVGRFSIDTKRVGFGGIGAEYTEAESAITIRVISTETGEIVAAVEAEGKKRLVGLSSDQADFSSSSDFNLGLAQQALSPAIDGMVEELGKREDVLVSFDMAVPASIVGEGRNGAIYLDKGENFGIAVGARFEVLRVVDEIVDASGTVLDRITERVGVLEVEQVLSQSSIAKITEGEAQEGDMLRPISSSD